VSRRDLSTAPWPPDLEERLRALERRLASLPGLAPPGGAGVLERVEAGVSALADAWMAGRGREARREAALEEVLAAVAGLGALDFGALRQVSALEDESLQALVVGLSMMSEEIAHANREVVRARDEALAARSALEATAAELAERSEELDAANRSLSRALRMKDEFLAGMSHELRTPLNAVLGFAESLAAEVYGPVNARQEEALARIDRSGRHLIALIDDILDLARMGAGRIVTAREPVELRALCEEAAEVVRGGAVGRGLTVTCEAPRPVQVRSDRRRVLQIVLNLLSNAVKFTVEGGVGVRLDVDAERREARISVWDTGIGIAPEDRPRLFHPFVQLESGLSRRYAGAGLGLALSASLAEQLGGHVDLVEGREQGSCFTLSLPWGEGAADGD
jgi:signal transduction histidine kinase